MIKLIHQYNRVITYVFLFVAFCFMFSGVGLDMLQGGGSFNQHAIKVNDKEISFREYEAARENLTQRYRSMFGDNFETFAKSFNLDVSQQAVDALVDTTLLEQAAQSWGFAGSDESVNRYLVTKVFAGTPITKDALRERLQGLGMNFKQLSAKIREEVARETFSNVLRDVAFVSDQELKAQYVSQETSYSVTAATLQVEDFIPKVAPPAEDALKALYESSATEYELPAQVAYEYLAFNPKDFEDDVQVLPQDIEFYYTENPTQFKTPEQARIRSITLLYPKSNDSAAMAEVKAKAKQAHEEAVSGKPFTELVQKYSDDLPTKLAGGEKGWVARGKGSKAFDKAVFSASTGSVADLIEADFGFEIVRVEEKKESGQKPFSEVKGQIEAQIRTREAPAYAAAKAQELVAATKKQSAGITQIAAQMNLPAPKVASLSQQGQDPDPMLQGLTQRALQLPASDRLIATTIEVGDTTVALQIKEFKEPSIQPFDAVKEKVLKAYNKREAGRLAEQAAKELVDATKTDPAALVVTSTAKGYRTVPAFDISRAKPSSPSLPGLAPDFSKEVFASSKAPRALSEAYSTPEGYVVAAVTKVTQPDLGAESSRESLKEYRENAAERAAQRVLQTTVTQLKANASVIDVDPSLLAARS